MAAKNKLGKNYELVIQTYAGNDFRWLEDEGFDPNQEIFVQLKSVSEDYFNYFNTVSLQSWTSGDPFSEPVQVYSNVQDGFGIFAGYQSSWHKIDITEWITRKHH